MPKPPPAALGDAYPALRNFLKLTALTLEVHQVALTVQVGSRPYSTGALSYGPVTQAALRQMLQQPQPALAAITETLSLGTLYHNISLAPSWSQASPEPEELPEVQEPLEELRPTASEASPRPAPPTSCQTAMVGRIHPPKTSYYLTLYIPGMVAESLAVSQVKNLAYLTQQLLMCLRVVPLPPELVPPPLPSHLGTSDHARAGGSPDTLASLVQPNNVPS